MPLTVRQRVLAYLESAGLKWSRRGDAYALRFQSALVLIHFHSVGDQTLVLLRAPVLRKVSCPSDAATLRLLRSINELNRSATFSRWIYDPEAALVLLEATLLGDFLQEEELLTCLAAVARAADRHDNELQSKFGGVLAFSD